MYNRGAILDTERNTGILSSQPSAPDLQSSMYQANFPLGKNW
jgi:hypothetical protein